MFKGYHVFACTGVELGGKSLDNWSVIIPTLASNRFLFYFSVTGPSSSYWASPWGHGHGDFRPEGKVGKHHISWLQTGSQFVLSLISSNSPKHLCSSVFYLHIFLTPKFNASLHVNIARGSERYCGSIFYSKEDQGGDACRNRSVSLRLPVKYQAMWELDKSVSSNLWLCNQRTLLNIFYGHGALVCIWTYKSE